jgi:uncharacterized membrane protein YphA (DoxX/SURF4 family)
MDMSKRYYEWSMLILRLALGIVFISHGLQKFSGMEGTIKFFASLGMPAIAAYGVATIESVGGALLIVGFLPRIAAAAICLVMLGAIFTVKMSKGLIGGYEFELALLAMAFAVMLSGSSLFALQNLFPALKSEGKKTET